MNWVDWAILVLVALAGMHGLRLGAAMQVLSFGGFWLGLLFGALLAPVILHHVTGNLSKTIVAAVVIFGLAGLVGGMGRVLGSHSSNFLRRLRLGPVDSGFGAVVAVVATLLAAWLVANIVVNSRYTSFDAALRNSTILRAIDSIMPSPPGVFSRIESFLATEGFPVVFTGLPPSAVGPVAPPSNAAVAAAVDAAGPSTVQIAGEGCGVIQEGSGFVVAPDYVLTNAHVVAGIPHPDVIDTHGRHSAYPMLFDPQLDISVLYVPGLPDPPIPVAHLDDSLVGRGASGAVMGYPEGGPFAYGAAAVEAVFDATGLDIYGNAQTVRTVYQLSALVQPGNSGGPLVEPDGEVIGVVFARSTSSTDVGYALAMPKVLADVRVGEQEPTSRPVSTQGCVNG
ncbi:MAG TPA: MarP family serine protease [Acidimicrobiales bacterium]|nr:MarP family serine protease [Acidimicrobiales bacterium]